MGFYMLWIFFSPDDFLRLRYSLWDIMGLQTFAWNNDELGLIFVCDINKAIYRDIIMILKKGERLGGIEQT